MIVAFCLFIPPLLGAAFSAVVLKQRPTLHYYATAYSLMAVAINAAVFAVLTFGLHGGGTIINESVFTFMFALKYLCISGIFALAFGALYAMLYKNITITMEVRRCEKKTKVKKSKITDGTKNNEENAN